MSDSIRVYLGVISGNDDETSIAVRCLGHDDLEVTRRKPHAEAGELVVDVKGSGNSTHATFDLADLLRLVKREYPEQFERIASEALTAEEFAFSQLVRLDQHVQSLVRIARETRTGESSGFDVWSHTFDQVFSASISGRVVALFDEIRFEFRYYDPDGSYEDDVVAFANAFHDRVAELTSRFPAVQV
jgi:hypothetical protein